MIRTPSVTDSSGGARSEKQATERNQMVKTADQMVQLDYKNGLKVSAAVESSLMPTPTVFHVSMHDEPIETFLAREEKSSTGQLGKSLGVALRMEMMPTPVASEGSKAPAQQDAETKSKNGQVWLSNEAKGLSNKDKGWGKFEPAIRRWETTLGRQAPAPTKADGKDGNHRLSSSFTEWMMGLPQGWITSVGLKRNDELKACGNGVVPQQAEMALRILLGGLVQEDAKQQGKLFATPNTMDSLPPRYGEAYERVRNAGGRKNRASSGNLREQVVHLLPQPENHGVAIVNLPTPTVSDTFTSNLKSSQQKEGSMHSVTLPQAVERLVNS